MTNPITLNYDVAPVAHQSVRAANGHFYQPTKIGDFKDEIILETRRQLPPGFKMFTADVPLSVYVEYHFKYLKKEKKSNIGLLIPKITKPDLADNLSKAFIDALAGIVFENDAQICTFTARKFYWESNMIQAIIRRETWQPTND